MSRLAGSGTALILAFVFAAAPAWAGPSGDPQCEQALLGPEASIQQAKALAADWLARRGKDVKETLTNPWNNPNAERRHAEVWEVSGIPARLREISPKGKIFRHYASRETIEAIRKSKVLQSGFLPYVELNPGVLKKNWNDVTGAFLTVPTASPANVGVERGADSYVDFKVPEGVPVLELEPDNIYVIPLAPSARGWVRDIYRKWKSTGEVSEMYKDMVERLDRAGGVPASVGAVPIEIVGTGKQP